MRGWKWIITFNFGHEDMIFRSRSYNLIENPNMLSFKHKYTGNLINIPMSSIQFYEVEGDITTIREDDEDENDYLPFPEV